MSIQKSVLAATVAFATLGMSAAAVAAPSILSTEGAGFVVGVQGGYADEHWDNFFSPHLVPANDVKDTGFAARGYLGYDLNKYLGVEAGYTYLPKTTVNGLPGDIKNYTVDLLAKLSVPVTNVFSLYAKAGGAYYNAKFDDNIGSFSNNHIGPAFGVGASYEVVPNLAIDLSWMRFSGQSRTLNGNYSFEYQPSPDVVLLGVSYKFPVHYS